MRFILNLNKTKFYIFSHIKGLSFLKRKLSSFTKQTLFISKIGSNLLTILSIHLPIGITIKNTINCTEGIEFYHGICF